MGVRDIYIQQHLLKPLGQLFGQLGAEQEQHYLESFKKATDTELKDAFIWLRDHYDYSKFPRIPDIHKAIREASKSTAVGHRVYSEGHKLPWEITEENRLAAVTAYMQGYESDFFFLDASQGGYADELRRYARAVAEVQIQIIIPSPNGIGWNGMDIFGVNTCNHPEFRQRRKDFWIEQRRQAATGRIEVTVPDWRLDMMRAHAARPRPTEAKRTSLMVTDGLEQIPPGERLKAKDLPKTMHESISAMAASMPPHIDNADLF